MKRDWVDESRQVQDFLETNPRWRQWIVAPWVDDVQGLLGLTRSIPDVRDALRQINCPKRLWPWVRSTYQRRVNARASRGLKRIQPFLPVAGLPDRFRSEWERRLAAALDRLGIGWDYERDRFEWVDARGGCHTYTPDFVLLGGPTPIYVEVKGPAGANALDDLKMRRALQRHRMVLLVWGASVIEMVEDMASATEVMGLLNTTRLAA